MTPILYAKYALMFIEAIKELKRRKSYYVVNLANNYHVLNLLDISESDRIIHGEEIIQQFAMDYRGYGINS